MALNAQSSYSHELALVLEPKLYPIPFLPKKLVDSHLFKLPYGVHNVITSYLQKEDLNSLSLASRDCLRLARSRRFGYLSRPPPKLLCAMMQTVSDQNVWKFVQSLSVTLYFPLGMCGERKMHAHSQEELDRFTPDEIVNWTHVSDICYMLSLLLHRKGFPKRFNLELRQSIPNVCVQFLKRVGPAATSLLVSESNRSVILDTKARDQEILGGFDKKTDWPLIDCEDWRLETLQVDKISWDVFLWILNQCKGTLRNLKIWECIPLLEFALELLPALPALSRLFTSDLHLKVLEALLRRAPSLQYLEVCGEIRPMALPSIKRVSFSYTEGNLVKRFLSANPQVERLEILGGQLDDFFERRFCDNYKNLTHLSLSFERRAMVTNPIDVAFDAIGELVGLKWLHIGAFINKLNYDYFASGVWKIQHQVMRRRFRNLKRLERLYFDGDIRQEAQSFVERRGIHELDEADEAGGCLIDWVENTLPSGEKKRHNVKRAVRLVLESQKDSSLDSSSSALWYERPTTERGRRFGQPAVQEFPFTMPFLSAEAGKAFKELREQLKDNCELNFSELRRYYSIEKEYKVNQTEFEAYWEAHYYAYCFPKLERMQIASRLWGIRHEQPRPDNVAVESLDAHTKSIPTPTNTHMRNTWFKIF